jgi:hypothetical protein
MTRELEQHLRDLAREGVSWGLTPARVMERLRVRIHRDETYLGYRTRKGRHTYTDDAIAIAYLEGRNSDESS